VKHFRPPAKVGFDFRVFVAKSFAADDVTSEPLDNAPLFSRVQVFAEQPDQIRVGETRVLSGHYFDSPAPFLVFSKRNDQVCILEKNEFPIFGKKVKRKKRAKKGNKTVFY